MKRRIAVFIVIWSVTLLVAACSEPLIPVYEEQTSVGHEELTNRENNNLKSFTVRATRYEFDPQEIRVQQGDLVEIKLENDKGYHTIKIEGYNLEVKKNRTLTFVASEKGEFVFRCGIVCGSGHENMTGMLIIE